MVEKRYPRTVLSTVCIPWKDDLSFDEAVFRKTVQAVMAQNVKAIYLFGTAGEGYAVDQAQYTEIVSVFADETLRVEGVMPMVGVISLSMSEMIRRIEIGCALGIRDFQISFPSWGALTDDEVYTFFHSVCDQFPDCRFMHYNNGGRSKKMLQYQHYKRLADEIPNLVAVKYMSDSIEDIVNIMRSELPIQFILSEYGYGLGSLMGECGMLFSSVSMHYPTAWKLFQAGVDKDVPAIMELERQVAVSQEVLFETCTGQVMNAAYDKVYFKAGIPETPLSLYPPYKGFSQEQYDNFIRVMKQRLPEWF